LNSYKIGIIKKADKLTAEAQSALLKTLEEPRDKVIVILLASSEDNLLPTILSRGQKLYFQAVNAETIYDYLIAEYGTKRTLAKDLANLSLGRPLRAVKFLED
jgi:DNA polymerase-3 subunit delta'